MKTYKEYEDYLRGRGYVPDLSEKICEDYYRITFSDNKGNEVRLEAEGKTGDSMDDIEIVVAEIMNAPIGFSSDVYLESQDNRLSHFECCIDIQKNGILKHESFILKKHMENVEWILENLDPILNHYDFKCKDSSVLHPVGWEDFDDDCLAFQYIHEGPEMDESGYSIIVKTDIFTGDLSLDSVTVDPKGLSITELNNLIIREFLFNPRTNELYPEFEYLFSNDESISRNM